MTITFYHIISYHIISYRLVKLRWNDAKHIRPFHRRGQLHCMTTRQICWIEDAPRWLKLPVPASSCMNNSVWRPCTHLQNVFIYTPDRRPCCPIARYVTTWSSGCIKLLEPLSSSQPSYEHARHIVDIEACEQRTRGLNSATVCGPTRPHLYVRRLRRTNQAYACGSKFYVLK